MGLAETIQSAAQAAHAAIGNIEESATYHVTGTLTYSTSTGAVSESAVNDEDITVGMVFVRYDKREPVINTVRKIEYDLVGLIPRLNLKNAAGAYVTPKLSDRVVRADSSTWQITGIEIDPANAEWKLFLKRL